MEALKYQNYMIKKADHKVNKMATNQADNKIIEQNNSTQLLELTDKIDRQIKVLNEVIAGVEYASDDLGRIVGVFKIE